MVQDIDQAFSTQYPSTLQWNNRQAIGILFPTSVSGLNNDNTSANEALSFSQGLLSYAASSIDQMLADGEQGMVSWDMEGDPVSGTYVGDPTLALTLDPNLNQPIPPQSDFNSDVAKYYVSLPASDNLADEYFAMFTKAGLEVGVTLRADQAEVSTLGSTPAQNIVWHQFTSDPAQVLISKIEYAEQNWGCTLFYIDSIEGIPNVAAVLAEVHAAVPNVLLIPEGTTVAGYASAASYGQTPTAATDPPLISLGAVSTPAGVVDVYPNAFSVTRDVNAQGTQIVDEDLPAISQAILRGDAFFSDNGSASAPVNTALNTLAFDDAVYTSQNTTQSLGNDTMTLRADGPNAYEILRDGLVIYSGQIAGSPQLDFNFGGSNDTLIIDTSAGNPIPSAGILFNGGATSKNNTLIVVGAGGNDAITFGATTVSIGSSAITFKNVANREVEPRSGVNSLTINAGKVLLPAQIAGHGILTENFSSLTVASGASLVVATAPIRSDITRITTDSLTVRGTLDLGGNEMMIDYAPGSDPVSTIRSLLAAGYNGGAWNGASANGAIDSSAAGSSAAGGNYALGYADGADGVVSGLSSGQIEILYTLYGDANLDGMVSSADSAIVAANYGKNVTNWDQGNFNYEGVVNGTDLGLLNKNYSQSARVQ